MTKFNVKKGTMGFSVGGRYHISKWKEVDVCTRKGEYWQVMSRVPDYDGSVKIRHKHGGFTGGSFEVSMNDLIPMDEGARKKLHKLKQEYKRKHGREFK